ncbi:MAG: type II toxin-antitoxin system RelE/ParE family toxin [Deltaproteobacteria bacterium]|nr:type II toxin-antitoxin system RelE/ParE family toxin [Deltaproteobacteria bacterium]
MEVKEKKIQTFETNDGKVPFEDWIKSLKDKKVRARIFSRIDRLRLGNFGDCRSVGGGVYELRIHFGAGYRVYFGLEGDKIVILLCGGDKKTQKKDIECAQMYWKECK